jgi:hypothetical protein
VEIKRASYCYWANIDGHDENNCRQCELLERLFFRIRGLALQSCAVYQGETLHRTEAEVSKDIQNAINSVEFK